MVGGTASEYRFTLVHARGRNDGEPQIRLLLVVLVVGPFQLLLRHKRNRVFGFTTDCGKASALAANKDLLGGFFGVLVSQRRFPTLEFIFFWTRGFSRVATT